MNGYSADEINNVSAVSGQNVHRLRRAAGMSQQDVVNELAIRGVLGWYPTTVHKTETGQRTLRLNEAMALADTLNVLLDDLATDPDSDGARYRRAVDLSGRFWEIDAVLQFVGRRYDELKAQLQEAQRGGDGSGERGEAPERDVEGQV